MAADLLRPAQAVPSAAIPFGARAWVAATAAMSVAAAVAAILLAPPASARPPEALAFLLFVGSSVHVASTGWFYTDPEMRGHFRGHLVRYLLMPVLLIAGTALLFQLGDKPVRGWLLLGFFSWQLWHYQKQNVGVQSFVAAGTGSGPLSVWERRTLMVAAVIALRLKAPHLHRPYRTIGYPLPVLTYITLAVLLILDFIYLKPLTSGKGFLIVLAGIPVYLIWSRVAARSREQD